MLTLPTDFDALRDWLAHRLDTARQPAGGDIHTEDDTTPAAVLVPIVMRPDAPTILLTKRHAGLAKHAGQISFPGGRTEIDETPEQAALRETEEEVGIAPTLVRTVGRLSHYTTITRYKVTPVVALVQPDFVLALQADEVEEVFEVPLSFVLNPASYIEKSLNLPERRMVTYALDWQGKIIWGATAGMLMMLRRTLEETHS
ncbi:CoA pyrophosphatase [Chitinimonas sp. BJYL2]|uniref:CoA pyrophosphatase n=1 Tax=Chitinimonas sp. BJYL2 TaxID=2976696 RepID=UPI0022B5A581|nr:CoA pyrophosphatase [Chitinimonas sp. BJYL2]